ncbi:uncharacterized protein Z519_04731 [Cladophialophora bantiana CBS 173.52]|uniref:Uncharacterized protein n=1 Tax=Cladophialophora bantiana (strain ATCC 10958 / CBS 173.52 / CDC B-1940 / NIH 8579) TaxID=1442370 RepID=A0A0D2IDC5_CLAB1|nr:uncharacterized protein Z519_04731 [Cladophialophora bantiana CBS 173.52]KIW94754.1 hypothetical protein Z519_04731 [Cladophialophora bantiana CBS 173.52]
MVKPSPQLCARLRFTTKQVGRGFYRGNRTGSMGAHTEYGRYMIDWRKTVHYNMPDTKDFPLSPFVTMEMEPKSRAEDRPDGTTYIPNRVDALEFLRTWKKLNPLEYDGIVAHQEEERRRFAAAAAEQIHEQAQEDVKELAPEQVQMRTQKQAQVQQQTRHMHTMRRLWAPVQATVIREQPNQPVKDFYQLSRAERKELVNKATTSELRQRRRDRKGHKITQQEKKETKKDIKLRLRRELIGDEVFQDERELQKILIEEGRRRKQAGLPRATHEEKGRFLENLQRKAQTRGLFDKIFGGERE